MKKIIRAIQFGCGPVGCAVAALATQRKEIRLVGAVDTNPEKIGRDLGELGGLNRKLGVVVSDDLKHLLALKKPDLAFHTTASSLKLVSKQLETLLRSKLRVVSSCEELAYPYWQASALAKRLDSLAKKMRVCLLATGINPGFLMDSWPLFMTGVCQKVEKIVVRRIQNASNRRGPFQRKIGAGLSVKEFEKKVSEKSIRHVGLTESIAMIAAGLGWKLDQIQEEIVPVLAEQEQHTQYLAVRPGDVSGVRQIGRGICQGREAIVLEFEAAVGSRHAYDSISITGIPNLEVKIPGGVHGDLGTAAMLVNAAQRVMKAPAGVLSMKDLPLVCCGLTGV